MPVDREGFKSAIQAYINAIIPDPDAKGTMIEAFEHYHMAKPKGRKRMFFKTHPESWQDSYMDTAVNFREKRMKKRLKGKKVADEKETVNENKASDVKETTGKKTATVNANKENGARDTQMGIALGSSVTSIQRTNSMRHIHNTPVLTTPIWGILTQTDDLADDLEAEVMEPEEDPTRITMAGEPEVEAMEPVQEENLYPTIKSTMTNGGDRTIQVVIIMKTPIPTLRRARPVTMRPKDRARIHINNTRRAKTAAEKYQMSLNGCCEINQMSRDSLGRLLRNTKTEIHGDNNDRENDITMNKRMIACTELQRYEKATFTDETVEIANGSNSNAKSFESLQTEQTATGMIMTTEQSATVGDSVTIILLTDRSSREEKLKKPNDQKKDS
eukprot:jgi/Psemu1/45995/gm1.45995_g